MVRYFGESPKTTPPSVFFPVFARFIHSYKVSGGGKGSGGAGGGGVGCGLPPDPLPPPTPLQDAEQENETRKKQEEVMREKLLAQEAKKQEKVCRDGPGGGQGLLGGCTTRPLTPPPLQRNKWQQQELIAELRRRQAKEHRPVYEGKDGTIEDIITGTAPPTAPPPDPPTP